MLREEQHKDGTFGGHQARAELSLTSYVLDGADVRKRPVTFAFNGGPGSSSVWLHLGLLGPRRVAMGDVGALEPPPYDLVDNPESLLAVSDLVFIDPMSTGWSRAVEGGKPGDFHGYQKDIESVAELIRLWTSRHRRWMSPEVRRGRVLRHPAGSGARGAPPGEVRALPQRADPHLERARPVVDRLRQAAQRPRARALPADVCRDRPLPRQARPPRAAGSARRGGGVCRPRLPVGARPGVPG